MLFVQKSPGFVVSFSCVAASPAIDCSKQPSPPEGAVTERLEGFKPGDLKQIMHVLSRQCLTSTKPENSPSHCIRHKPSCKFTSLGDSHDVIEQGVRIRLRNLSTSHCTLTLSLVASKTNWLCWSFHDCLHEGERVRDKQAVKHFVLRAVEAVPGRMVRRGVCCRGHWSGCRRPGTKAGVLAILQGIMQTTPANYYTVGASTVTTLLVPHS